MCEKMLSGVVLRTRRKKDEVTGVRHKSKYSKNSVVEIELQERIGHKNVDTTNHSIMN